MKKAKAAASEITRSQFILSMPSDLRSLLEQQAVKDETTANQILLKAGYAYFGIEYAPRNRGRVPQKGK